jgi:hypothetical protein
LTYTILFRIFYRMKVTALIPDKIVDNIKVYAHGRNLTESIIIALEEWIALKKIHELNSKIDNSPLKFKDGFLASNLRNVNRKR